ncbi:hypothetical protein BC826DRAFT_973463 [Russula brevipes]|nr:hypothetical protein BC826DRAFT_973463 [Russula brevipes]
MITRPANADKHPGDIQRLSGARRPKDVVAAERAAKTAAKVKAAAAKETGIQKVAQIENEGRKKRTSDHRTSRINERLTIPRVTRARKGVDEQDDFSLDSNRTASGTLCSSEDDDFPDEQSPNEKTKGCSLSVDGENSPEEESASSESYETDLDDERLEPTIKKTYGKNKKLKKGMAVRARINTVAADMAQDDRPNVEGVKRKAGTDTETSRTKKPKPPTSSTVGLSGVSSGWKKNKAPQVNLSRAPSTASTRTTVSRRASSTITMDHEDGATASDDGPAFAFGGIPSDTEDVERPGPQYDGSTNRYRSTPDGIHVPDIQSLAKIEVIHAGPPRLKPGQVNSANNNGRVRIKNSHLPVGTTERFTRKVLPIALDTVGALAPWDYPDDQQIIDIWNLVFGSWDDHPITGGDVKGDLFIAVKGLIKRGISTWLHKFATAAEKALSMEFEHQGLSGVDEKAAFVQYLLGDTNDMSSKCRPFLWKTAYESDQDEDVRLEVLVHDNSTFVLHLVRALQGIFQGRLVARTFLEHILATSSIEDSNRVLERPVGALIMSIQAVHRTLLYSVEGSFKNPGSKSGAFSKANWGDYNTQSTRGESTIKRASVFLKRITSLKDQQWDDIFKAALMMQEHSKQVDAGEHGCGSDDGGTGEDSGDDDDVLFDPLYDEAPEPSSSSGIPVMEDPDPDV